MSNNDINSLYKKLIIKHKCEGGKLIGAGGGGFLLLYASENKQTNLIKEFKNMPHFKFNFDTNGTRITYYDSE